MKRWLRRCGLACHAEAFVVRAAAEREVTGRGRATAYFIATTARLRASSLTPIRHTAITVSERTVVIVPSA